MKKKFSTALMLLAVTVFTFMPFINVKAIEYGHNNIWKTGNGEVAVLYENRNPQEQPNLNGDTWGNGEVVDYQVGDEITVKARANDGNHFVGWYVSDVQKGPDYYKSNQLVSTSEEYTYKPGVTEVDGIDEPINYLTAKFDENKGTSEIPVHVIFFGEGGTYTISFNTENEEELAKQGIAKNNSTFFLVPDGEEMTLIATPEEGYYFKGWYETYEEDVDGQGTMEWRVGPVLDNNRGLKHVPEENDPYIMPVFGKEEELIDYTLDADDGNQIIMKDVEGRVLVFNSTEITSLTDEQLEEIASIEGATVEELKEMLEGIISGVKTSINGKGTLLGIYQFSISDGSPNLIHEAPGGFKIRIKITDAMKGYDKYTLYYMNDEYDIEDVVELTKNGDYFEGILPHLSGYVLVGSNNTVNPDTGDNIILYISILGLSVLGLVGIGIYSRKRKFN